MNPTYLDGMYEQDYSQKHRSRSNSGVSTTEALFHSLKLAESQGDTLDPNPYTSTRPQSSQGLDLASRSQTHIRPTSPTSGSFLSTPSIHRSYSQSNLSRISEPILNTSWLDAQPQQTIQVAPQLQISPPTSFLEIRRSASSSNTQTASMSTIALQYDSTFNMAGRSPYGWPAMDNNSMLGHDLGSYASDINLAPSSHHSRSLTGSPPRMLTPQQRELKRRTDQARHDHKIVQRQRRAGSGSSYVPSPPLSMAELTTGASSMPIYSSAPSQISLLTEPASSVTPHQYLPSYAPPIDNHFSPPYQPQPYMYSTSYPTPAAQSMPPHYGRPTMGDHNMMYQSVNTSPMGAGVQDGQGGVRVVQSRPKPQCWEHGCNGRQFSTFSNLLRHQREKSGQATKATCPNCGAEFTRTTARNGHLLHDKCKGKRSSTSGSVSGSGNRSD